MDRDPQAIAHAQREFGGDARVAIRHGSFADLADWEATQAGLDGVLLDLGVSSPQLDDAARGFSFQADAPLDMRMDPTQGETALELIERLSQDELANVIYELGEERRSRRVARCIKQALEAGELKDTLELRRAVVRAVGPRRLGGVDPATKTFQALRIAVNGELDQLLSLLDTAKHLLAPGGIAAIISFHSLEDRLVKRAFLDRSSWQRLHKKPVLAGETELAENPRARSAKLRAAIRIEAEAPSDPSWGEEA